VLFAVAELLVFHCPGKNTFCHGKYPTLVFTPHLINASKHTVRVMVRVRVGVRYAK